jgi:hypothetical protein
MLNEKPIKLPASRSRPEQQKVNRPKTNHGASKLFSSGGSTMAKKNPFAAFEKSGKDKEVKGKGKEGSKKEEAFDKGQMKFAKGGFVRAADGCATKGKTKAKQVSMKKGGKC